MQYRHMRLSQGNRWVPSLNTNGIDWNAGAPKSLRHSRQHQRPKSKCHQNMATRKRHGAGYGNLAFPCCGASHGNLLSPRSAAPNLPSDGTTTFMPV